MYNFVTHPIVRLSTAGILILFSILSYVFYDELKDVGFTILGFEFFHRAYDAMGRIGFSILWGVLGILVGYVGLRDLLNKNSKTGQK